MFERINYKNILYSVGIGVTIGLSSRLLVNGDWNTEAVIINALFSGLIGLLIGVITEVVLARLPIRFAKPLTFFLINLSIALFITGAILLSAYFFVVEGMTASDIMKVLLCAFFIILLANLFDYYRYKKANKQLTAFKEKKQHSP